jgi:hypothetical protein
MTAALETHEDTQVQGSPGWIGLATVNALIVSGETFSKLVEISRTHTITAIIGCVVQNKQDRVSFGVVYYSLGVHCCCCCCMKYEVESMKIVSREEEIKINIAQPFLVTF